jgi:hypothetical protein
MRSFAEVTTSLGQVRVAPDLITQIWAHCIGAAAWRRTKFCWITVDRKSGYTVAEVTVVLTPSMVNFASIPDPPSRRKLTPM